MKSTNQPPFLAQISTFFNNAEYSDLTVVCGSSEWKLNKIVVCSVSEFFRAACKYEMKEKQEGVVTLKEIDENVASEMLKFLYTGSYTPCLELPASSKGSPDELLTSELHFHVAMYVAGDMYIIPSLKVYASKCFEQFCESQRLQTGFGGLFLDTVRLAEKIVPFQVNDPLRKIMLNETRLLLSKGGLISDEITCLFLDSPAFGASFAAEVTKWSKDGGLVVDAVEMRCCGVGKESEARLHRYFLKRDDFAGLSKLSRSCPGCQEFGITSSMEVFDIKKQAPQGHTCA